MASLRGATEIWCPLIFLKGAFSKSSHRYPPKKVERWCQGFGQPNLPTLIHFPRFCLLGVTTLRNGWDLGQANETEQAHGCLLYRCWVNLMQHVREDAMSLDRSGREIGIKLCGIRVQESIGWKRSWQVRQVTRRIRAAIICRKARRAY